MAGSSHVILAERYPLNIEHSQSEIRCALSTIPPSPAVCPPYRDQSVSADPKVIALGTIILARDVILSRTVVLGDANGILES